MSKSPENAGIRLLLVAICVLGLFTCSRENQNASDAGTAESSTLPSIQNTSERIIYRGDPPYLVEQPILDGNLFVNHSDDFLLLGGTNIEQIRFSAGTRAGGKASFVYRENAIAFLMEEQPYIEFTYENKFYSLQILSRPYFFTMDFREIPSASIQLTEGVR